MTDHQEGFRGWDTSVLRLRTSTTPEIHLQPLVSIRFVDPDKHTCHSPKRQCYPRACLISKSRGCSSCSITCGQRWVPRSYQSSFPVRTRWKTPDLTITTTIFVESSNQIAQATGHGSDDHLYIRIQGGFQAIFPPIYDVDSDTNADEHPGAGDPQTCERGDSFWKEPIPLRPYR